MIGTLVSREPKLTKKEDKYYNVKTDVMVEGADKEVSFNAFNNNDDKHADIVGVMEEGQRIEFDVEKDGKYWNLKSIKLAGTQEKPVVATETSSVDAFGDREKSKQLSISTLAMLKSFIEAGLTPDMLQSYAAKCYKVSQQIYDGSILQYLKPEDKEQIPF